MICSASVGRTILGTMCGLVCLLTPGLTEEIWSVTHIPKKICAVLHSSVVLPCKYTHPSGQQLVAAEWLFMKTGGTAFEKVSFDFNRATRSNCSLRLNNVIQHNAGTYRFSFRTSVTPQDITDLTGIILDVTDLKMEMDSSSDDVVLEGDWVALTCGSCIPSLNVPTYFWYKDGTEYAQTNGDNTLHLNSITLKHAGSYSCSISNSEGYSSSRVSFTVQYPPKKISTSIRPSGDIKENSTVTLTCRCDGSPPVQNYTWFKGTTSVRRGETYTISNIRSDQSGEYKCKCSNDHGVKYSTAGIINVLCPPKNVFVSISPSGRISEGGSVTLTCNSDGTPPVQSYSWFREEETSPVGSGQTFTFLMSSSSESFFCRVKNELGSQRSAVCIVSVEGFTLTYYILIGVGIVVVVALIAVCFWIRTHRKRKQLSNLKAPSQVPVDKLSVEIEPFGSTVYDNLPVSDGRPPENMKTSGSVYENVTYHGIPPADVQHLHASVDQNEPSFRRIPIPTASDYVEFVE